MIRKLNGKMDYGLKKMNEMNYGLKEMNEMNYSLNKMNDTMTNAEVMRG